MVYKIDRGFSVTKIFSSNFWAKIAVTAAIVTEKDRLVTSYQQFFELINRNSLITGL
jgi:hypothetical protein